MALYARGEGSGEGERVLPEGSRQECLLSSVLLSQVTAERVFRSDAYRFLDGV